MKRFFLLSLLCTAVVLAAASVWKWPVPFSKPGTPSLQIPTSPEPKFPAKPIIRVNVTPLTPAAWTLSIDGPYTIRRIKDGRFLAKGESLKASKIEPTSSGIRIGRQLIRSTRVEIVPSRSPSIWVGTHQYRGSIRLIRHSAKLVLAINVLPIENYIASVINGEMPGSFPKEARKAQAIVARTYALYQAVRRRSSEYDVYADSRSQQYPGFQYRDKNGRRLAGENSKSRAIAFATLGIVCRSRGKLFHTYYSAVCGGRTLLGTEVFSDATTAFHSTRCEWCRQAKRYRWTHTIPHAVLASSLRDYFRKQRKAFGRLKSVSQVATSPGRLPEFVISDGRQGYQLTGAELRKIFGGSKIPSSRFSIQPVGSGLKLIGQGHGHGVGLCQWGAAGLASAGSNASQILRYYYRGITIEPHTR